MLKLLGRIHRLPLLGNIVFILAGATSCVGSHSRERLGPYLKTHKDRGLQSLSVDKESPSYVASLEFDQWLKNQLSKERSSQLESSCRSNSSHSPFCYSIVNFSELESRRELLKDKQKRRGSSRTIVPKFKNGTFSNWIELRFSPVSATLRGLNRTKPQEIELLRTKALGEEACPNNISISLAAFLEDQLPSKISYSNLAELYEKGGKCPAETPGDSEALSTRAGLLYLADSIDPPRTELLA
ncbi:MAG: hypothetical protein ACKN9V_10095, partial [Pseudomonadota bacterium]